MSRSHPSTADEEPWNTGRWFISSIMSKDILISRIHNAMTWSSLRAPEQARKRERCSLICPNVFSPPPNLPPGDNLWNLWQKAFECLWSFPFLFGTMNSTFWPMILLLTWLVVCTVVDKVVLFRWTFWHFSSISSSLSCSSSSLSSLSCLSSLLISGTRGRGGLWDLGGRGEEIMLGLLGYSQHQFFRCILLAIDQVKVITDWFHLKFIFYKQKKVQMLI